MKESTNNGIKTEGILPCNLKVVRKAKTLTKQKLKYEAPEIIENRLISAYAFAVNEENAAGGIVVTAPTCGASGTMPAVLKYMQDRYNFDDDILFNLSIEKVEYAAEIAMEHHLGLTCDPINGFVQIPCIERIQ